VQCRAVSLHQSKGRFPDWSPEQEGSMARLSWNLAQSRSRSQINSDTIKRPLDSGNVCSGVRMVRRSPSTVNNRN
jgi:hypothetical protein